MEGINWSRLLLSGLTAGLVMNISEFVLNGIVLAKTVETEMQKLNLSAPAGQFIAKAIGLTFCVGVIAMLFYAALRPRFEGNSKAAVVTGLLIWFLVYFYGGVLKHAMGLFSTDVSMTAIVWGLVEVPIATMIGALLYREAKSGVPALAQSSTAH